MSLTLDENTSLDQVSSVCFTLAHLLEALGVHKPPLTQVIYYTFTANTIHCALKCSLFLVTQH